MKALSLLSAGLPLLLCQSLLAQTPAPAPGNAATPAPAAAPAEGKKDDPAAAPAAKSGPAPQLRGLQNLTDDQRRALVAGMGEVAGYLRGVRNLEALEKLNELEAQLGTNYLLCNMRGAVYTKLKEYDKARPFFRQAIELAKDLKEEAFHPRFNLAELDFVAAGNAGRALAKDGKTTPVNTPEIDKLWNAAREGFIALLADPGKPGSGSDPLINFKLLICNLQLKREADAGVILSTFDAYSDDSPAYYFGHAAECFIKDDKEGANEWLESARKIYAKELNEVFNDSLVELGWLETLQ